MVGEGVSLTIYGRSPRIRSAHRRPLETLVAPSFIYQDPPRSIVSRKFTAAAAGAAGGGGATGAAAQRLGSPETPLSSRQSRLSLDSRLRDTRFCAGSSVGRPQGPRYLSRHRDGEQQCGGSARALPSPRAGDNTTGCLAWLSASDGKGRPEPCAHCVCVCVRGTGRTPSHSEGTATTTMHGDEAMRTAKHHRRAFPSFLFAEYLITRGAAGPRKRTALGRVSGELAMDRTP